jgi:type IV pilus assembly protein PilY1
VETTVDGKTITGDWATAPDSVVNCFSNYSFPIDKSNAGASNTLADVAAYYQQAELSRPQKEPKGDGTTPKFPLMTTYTLGFGVDGLLKYSPDYQKQAAGDFKDLTNGLKQWPVPVADDPSTIDDLWHAAVNGGGSYFSASEPQALTDALTTALKEIDDKIGAGAAAATSSLRPVLGTDQVFIGTYRTIFWDGNLSARTIKKTDQGAVIIGDEDWNAAGLLDVRAHTDRKILFMRRQLSASGAETRSLVNFSAENLSSDADATALTSHFANFCSPSGSDPVTPAQCASLTSTQKTAANGVNLVNFIRGDQSLEGTLYRKRSSLLGTIVDASPVVVGKPPFRYTDDGYNTFQSNNSARCPVVYTAANDGMLHAFSAATKANASECADGGTELWAYIPRAVMGNLYRLADTNYSNRHQFFVNATPVVGDIAEEVDGKPSWSTLLVGGFGAGGRGYYALDVTDPDEPKAKWEFSDADMGLSYGNPIITKVPDATGKLTWVVVFTSGLNNSGNGFLYVLNAHSGAVMYKIPTLMNGNPVGTSSAPSGLNKLNAWIDEPTNNTALRFYAGDMLGNIWRFNSETAEQLAPPAASAPDSRAFRLANLRADGAAQPITVRPELVNIDERPVVIVATGRYLGFDDLDDLTSLNSIYAIKDPLGDNPGWGDIRASDTLVEQTLTTLPADADKGLPERRTVSNNSVNWATKSGWYLDLETDDASERVVTNMTVLFDTLVVSSLVPVGDECSSSGYSWLYSLNINSGSYTNDQSSDQVVGERVNNVIVGTNAVQIGRGTKLTTTNSDGSVSLKDGPNANAGSGGLRRTSWREILPSTE